MIFLNGVRINDKQFPNGELNFLEIEEAIKARKGYRKNHFILKYEDDKDLMALHFAKKQVDLRTSDISTLSIAYMPYSRMDRAETFTVPFMLKYVCDFINDLKFQKVYVHEAHSAVTLHLLNDVEAIYDNIGFLQSIKSKENFNAKQDYIVFPDYGAFERYNGKIRSENMLFGEKTRDFTTGNITGLTLKGDAKKIVHNESKAIIVDDLSSYGGTFVRTAKELYALGFKEVILLVCHAENSIFKGELFNSLDRVYASDSMLTEHKNWENQKYQEQLTVFGTIEQMKEGNYK